MRSGRDECASSARLTPRALPRHIFAVLVPRDTGDERGNTGAAERQSVAAPATVSGEPASIHGHWETGKAGRNEG
jgi:hypothetical protein